MNATLLGLRVAVAQHLDALASDPPRGEVRDLSARKFCVAITPGVTIYASPLFFVWGYCVWLDGARFEVAWWGPWNPAARFVRAWRKKHEADVLDAQIVRLLGAPRG